MYWKAPILFWEFFLYQAGITFANGVWAGLCYLLWLLKPLMSWGFFMWSGFFFFFSRLCVFEGSVGFKLNIFHRLHQTFSPSCSDKTEGIIYLSWGSSIVLSPLKHTFGNSELLYWAALSCVWVKHLKEHNQRELMELPLTLTIPSESGQCGLLTWPPGIRFYLSVLQQDTTDWENSHNAQHSPLNC